MRLHVAAFVLAGIAAGSTAAVRADQVVYFTNGTSMEVRGHTLDGAMIRVDLGGGAVVGFPQVMVERIEDRGKSVYTNPAFRPANQAVAGSTGATRVEVDTTAIAGVPPGARYRLAGPRPAGGIDPNSPLVQAAYGDGGVPSAPRPETIAAGNGRIKVRGRLSAGGPTAEAPLGTVPNGNNYAVDSSGNGPRKQYPRMQPKSGAPVPAPSPDPASAPPATETGATGEGGEN
jgi:hypothetical protein